MCGGGAFWDLLVLDFAYFLVLTGGAMTLRARTASPAMWVAFGLLSFAVGTFLGVATSSAQAGLQASMMSGTTSGPTVCP